MIVEFKTYTTGYDESACYIGSQPATSNTYFRHAISEGDYRVVDGALVNLNDARAHSGAKVIRNRPLVRDTEIDPKDWPYPREPEWVELWNSEKR